MSLIARLLRFLNPRELLKYVLLYIFLWIVVSGIVPQASDADPNLLLTWSFLGLAIGWLVSRIPLPAWAAGFATGALAVEVALGFIGRMDLPLGDALRNAANLLAAALRNAPLPADAVSALAEAAGRLLRTPVSESIRLQTWLTYVVNGVTAYDPVASALVWSLLFLLIAAAAAWMIGARRQALPAVLPGLACLCAVLVYSRGEWYYALAALALILVLIVYMEFDRKEDGWIRRRLPYASDLRMDLVFASVVLIPGLLLAAAFIPAVNLGEVTRWVREQLTTPSEGAAAGPESLGILPGGGYGESNIQGGMPAEKLLHGGQKLTNQVMLIVVTGETPVFLPGSSLPAPVRHYWRGATYDSYTGRGWQSSPAEEESHAAGDILPGLPEHGRVLHQEVTANRRENGTLYNAGELATVDQPFQIRLRSERDLFTATVQASAYRADSVIPDATEEQLRAAGTVYPDWILRRYLQLPAGLPPRINALALSLAASAVTPYDQANVIQDYLRSRYDYSLEITAPPPSRDVVDYFLFDSRTGYCDYYASAMVVLARAAGISARLATGFGPGSFKLDTLQFIVLEADAHSWPELYFPGIGWVEFEPTSSRNPIQRPASAPPPVTPNLIPGGGSVIAALPAAVGAAFRVVLWVPVAVLALAFLWLAWIVLAPARIFWLPAPATLRLQYRALHAHALRLGVPVTAATTPRECARLLAARCQTKLTAAQLGLLQTIAEEYGRMVYGERPPDAGEGEFHKSDWIRLDWSLWRLRLRRSNK
jgi:transglutaminase-like putative cysteine protease